MENIKQKLLSEVAKTEQKCIELTGGIKVLKFERDDINSLVTKIKGEKEQALQTCELLEDKCTLNAKLITSLQKKLEEETHSESSQSLLRLNSRLHAENYKAIGRIIELNSKIRQTLHSDNVRKSSEEEQLGEVLSDFALHLETLINAYFSAKQQCS